MHVFISWSGNRANRAAQALSRWTTILLPHVDTATSRDLQTGEVWFTELVGRLRSSDAGIVCLTEENLHTPWLHFEGGALYVRNKPLFVVTLGSFDITGPFQAVQAVKLEIDERRDYEELLSVMKKLNSLSGAPVMSEQIVTDRFSRIWRYLQRDLRDAIAAERELRRRDDQWHKEIAQRLDSMDRHLTSVIQGQQRAIQAEATVIDHPQPEPRSDVISSAAAAEPGVVVGPSLPLRPSQKSAGRYRQWRIMPPPD